MWKVTQSITWGCDERDTARNLADRSLLAGACPDKGSGRGECLSLGVTNVLGIVTAA
jgi:hypothetical protein